MSFLNLPSEAEHRLSEFLTQVSTNTEFEIRFGKFNYNQETKRSNFCNEFDIEAFYKLKKMFAGHNCKSEKTNTVEWIYDNPSGRGSVKRIKNTQTNETVYILKNTLKNYNVFDYDLRFSLSSEKQIHENKLQDLDVNKVKCTREKSRTSYFLPCGKLDLTIVKEKENHLQTEVIKHEVELEITNTNTNAAQVIQYICVVLQVIQDNFFVIGNLERKNVIQEYRKMVNVNYFIGAQPETLQKNMLQNLYKETYSVTDKADGDRAFMVITEKGLIYFLDNNIKKISKTNLVVQQFKSCIIDGEIVKIGNQIQFYAFDILFLSGKDLRGDMKYLLEQRLAETETIIKSIECNDFYGVFVKTFNFKNVFLGAEQILGCINEKPYKNDGLIFTPMNEPYPTTKKWSKLLKWKPAELNTIDFYAVNNGDVWELYVQHSSHNKSSSQPVLFDTTKLFDTDKLCGLSKNVPHGSFTFQTTFGKDMIDPTTGESFKSHTVIEFHWDINTRKFVPLRTRWDKTANPNKHGNFSAVACDIWNNIHNPVEKELLFKFTVPNGKDPCFYERMRRFHNKIKEQLYNKYCKNTNHLLELCSGRGGDLHKWIYNKIQNVTGYDISDKNINECKRRVESMKDKLQNYNYSFYQIDLTSESAINLIHEHLPEKKFYDNICCHFAVHYFFKSQESFQNLLNIINSSLKPNGLFIITFMDNLQIDKLMETNEIFGYYNNEPVFLLKRDSHKLRIVLSGNNILSEGSDEYIIDYPYFLEQMRENNFELLESKLFEEVYSQSDLGETYNLTNIEKTISFLNRYAVFRKKEDRSYVQVQTPIQSVYKPPVTNVTSVFDFSTIELNKNKNISVYKIATKYDILAVLNCIEYNHYPNVIENKNLVTFDDIQTTFTTIKTHYTPVFLNHVDFSSPPISDNIIYFVYHKHIIEKKGDVIENTETTPVQFDNWYVVLYKNKLLFDYKNISEFFMVTKPVEAVEAAEAVEAVESVSVDNKDTLDKELHQQIKKYITSEKVTVKVMKEYLKQLGLNTTGKKDELYIRLQHYIDTIV